MSLDHRQLSKILPYISVSDDEIHSLLETEYNWEKFALCEQDSLTSTEDGVSGVFTRTNELVEAVARRYCGRAVAEASGLSDLIVSILLACDKPYQPMMKQLTSVSLDASYCIVMLRLGKADKLNEALQLPQVALSGNLALLLDRSVVYGQSKLVSVVMQHAPADTACYRRLASETAVVAQS